MTDWPPEEVARRPAASIAVDCHVHLFPDELFAAIGGWFADVGWRLPYRCRADAVLETLAGFGVEKFWALLYAHKPDISRGLNEFMAATMRRHPPVVGFFTVHPADRDPLAEARHAVEKLGLKGMKLHAEVQKLVLDDPRLDGVFDLLCERGLPCVLHAANDPYPVTIDRLDIRHLAARLRRNPDLKVVVGHLGSPQTRQCLALMTDYPHLYLETSFTNIPNVSVVRNPAPAELAPYADRLLFGSDFPYITFPYARQADAWSALPWVQAHQAAFFGGNAERLMAG